MAKNTEKQKVQEEVGVEVEKIASEEGNVDESSKKIQEMFNEIVNNGDEKDYYFSLTFSDGEGGMMVHGDTKLIARIIVQILTEEPRLFHYVMNAMAEQMLATIMTSAGKPETSNLN